MVEITPEIVESALKDVRRGMRLRSSPLIGLGSLRRGGARSEPFDGDAPREHGLRDLLCRLVAEGLAAARGVPARDLLDGRRPDAAVEAALAADFAPGDRDREAWSVLYHRYTAPVPLDVQAIAALTQAPGARNPERQIRRRCVLGFDKLAARLRELEREAAPDAAPGAATVSVPDAGRHNLPPRRNRYIRHEVVLAGVEALLGDARLLTLVGPGGVGKTRLALELARRQLPRWPDGVWFVGLGSVAHGDDLLPAVARVLHLHDGSEPLSLPRLVHRLMGHRMLLVLDNCEQVLEACATLADAILQGCEAVSIVATSRERLNVAGEQLWDVPTLEVPAVEGPAGSPAAVDPEALLHAEAVALFVDRVVEVNHGFRLDARNAADVGRLCRHLEGLPLAIELAAGRMRALSVGDILAQIEDLLGLLTHGAKGMPDRHRTMRAAIGWSHDLLSPPEKAVFARLAVFRGGWSFEAARAVCVGGPIAAGDVLDGLGGLVEQSLVEADVVGDMPRYRFLEPIRQFAVDRLAADGAADGVRDLHLAFFAALAERAEPELTGADQAAWLARLDRDYANLVAAMDHAVAVGDAEGGRAAVPETAHGEGDDPEGGAADGSARVTTGLRLAAAMWRYWDARGNQADGRLRLKRLLAAATADTPDAVRSAALHAAGVLAMIASDEADAVALLEAAADLRRKTEDWQGLGRTLSNLGAIQYRRDDLDEAQRLYAVGLSAARRAGDEWNVTNLLLNMSMVSLQVNDLDAAEAHLTEAIPVFDRMGDVVGMAAARHRLGLLYYRLGDDETATAELRTALAHFEHVGHRYAVAEVRRDLGSLSHVAGNYVAAEREFKRCIEICAAVDNRWVASLALAHLGQVMSDIGRGDEALAHFGHAWKMAVGCGNTHAQGEALNGIARTRLHAGERAEARVVLCRCLSIGTTVRSARVALPWLATAIRFLALDGCLPQAARLYGLYRAAQMRHGWRLPPAQEAELAGVAETLPATPAEDAVTPETELQVALDSLRCRGNQRPSDA